MKRFVLAGAFVLSSLWFANAAIVDTFTNSVLFDAAVPSAVLEAFDTAIASGRNNLVGTYDFGPFEIEKEYTGGSTGAQAGSYQMS